MTEQKIACQESGPRDAEAAPPPAQGLLDRLARHRPDGTSLIALASVVAFAIMATGCVSTAGIAPQAVALAPAAVGVQADAPAASVQDGWWRAFGDPQLDALVERGLAASPTLETARSRLARAAAQSDAARGNQGPRVDAGFDATRQRYPEHGLVPPPYAGSWQTPATAQFSAAWELDFFGRNRAALAAALGAERAAAAETDAARLAVAGNVVRGWFQLARLTEQRAVAERTLAQRNEVLGLVRQRVGGGLDTNVELRQSESSVPEVTQQVEALDEQIALARHALAALTAQPPDALDGAAPRLTAARVLPLPDRIPADLLGRRPDVEAARRRVEAAVGDVAAAKAATYPNVSLNAFAGFNALGLDNLLEAGSRQFGIGPAIRLPIFDAGRLRAAVRGRTADLDAAVAAYNATLLDAVRDAADQIAAVRSVERQRRAHADAEAGAENAYDLARQRYRAGLGTYLTVLNAETAVLAQRRLGADLRARALDSQAALARALGGGYVAPPDGAGHAAPSPQPAQAGGTDGAVPSQALQARVAAAAVR